MSFRELELLPHYTKTRHDIADDFYLPVMEQAMTYDRAVGFFSSSVYVLAWPALKAFVERRGRMRLVCSPILSPDDVDALGEGYSERVGEKVAGQLKEEVERMLADPQMERPTRVLASLVALGVIDVRIAFMGPRTEPEYRRLFHDKVGILRDSSDDTVAFLGSMNETWSGLSPDGNIESIDVSISWDGERDVQRIASYVEYFEDLWENRCKHVTVKPFPDTAREELIQAADPKNWPDLVEDIARELRPAQRVAESSSRAKLYHHQRTALQAWEQNGRRGILEHATGSGKTYTATEAIRESLGKSEVPIVFVPSQLLLRQWQKALEDSLADVKPSVLLAGDSHTKWRSERLLRIWTGQGTKPRIVLATMQTGTTPEFLGDLRQGQHLLIVVDEVHRIGSNENRKLLSVESGPRLGLSATPVRAGDPVGTEMVMSYFRGVVSRFTLSDAIAANILTPYMYHPHVVGLAASEQEEWARLTDRIRRLRLSQQKPGQSGEDKDDLVKRLQIERARVAKRALGKTDLAVRVMRDDYQNGQRWIVYCDDQGQLEDVVGALGRSGFDADEYHTSMKGDRGQTLRRFEVSGGILVSIRCLDEGVDIPTVDHALILASSRNPREFIQRRGRVLRKAPGKHLAHVHDALVVADSPSESAYASLAFGELSRAIEFGRGAMNPSATAELKSIALRMGLDPGLVSDEGVEEDE